MKIRKEDSSLIEVELEKKGQINLLEMKCTPLIRKSSVLRGENEIFELESFREDWSESTHRKGVKSFGKAEAMLESLRNNLTDFKNSIGKVTYKHKQSVMEHTSLIENYGNSGIIKGKGTDEIVKRNAIDHEIGCRSSKASIVYKEGQKDQLMGKHPPLIKKGNTFGVESANTESEDLENEKKMEFKNRVLKLVRGKFLAKLNEQEVVLKEGDKILENELEAKGKNSLRDLANADYDLKEIIKEGTVVEMSETGNNSVKVKNGDSDMVLGLRERAEKMISSRQITKNRKRLDVVWYEKEDLIELLEVKKEAMFLTTRSGDDHELGFHRLVVQRGHKQRSMSILGQRAPRFIRTLPRMREFSLQDFLSSNYVCAPTFREKQLKKAILVGDQNSSVNNEGNSDNSFIKQHEKVWFERLEYLDQEWFGKLCKRVSSTGIDVSGNDFQDDQKIEA